MKTAANVMRWWRCWEALSRVSAWLRLVREGGEDDGYQDGRMD